MQLDPNYFDNGPGKNKNITVLQLENLLFETGCFKNDALSFLVKGHAKTYVAEISI